MKELTIDLHDYIEGGSVFKRTAVRGVICREGKYLMIHSKYGDHKFPGGGMEKGESLMETLFREVKEETGYQTDLHSVTEGILVHEKRKGDPDDLMEMDSYYYFCNVNELAGERDLDDYEAEYDYRVVWLSLEEAIARNEAVENSENIPWIARETMVMKEILQMGTHQVR